MLRHLFCLLPLFALCKYATAQNAVKDSTVKMAAAAAVETYYQSLKDAAPLYNGSEYIEYTTGNWNGHPFFNTPIFVTGVVEFDNMPFKNIPILYDLVKDQLVILHYNKTYKMKPAAGKVNSFTIDQHYFIYLSSNTAGNQLKEGFYEQLCAGKAAFLAKRQKKVLEDIEYGEIVHKVRSRTDYYLLQNGTYLPVKNLRSLLHILKPQKKQIQQYLKQNHIKYKENPELAMTTAASYYNKLNN
jgi:hypothetical protein